MERHLKETGKEVYWSRDCFIIFCGCQTHVDMPFTSRSSKAHIYDPTEKSTTQPSSPLCRTCLKR